MAAAVRATVRALPRMLARVLLAGGAAMVGYLVFSLVADPARAEAPQPEQVAAAEGSALNLLEGEPLGSTVEATLDGLLPGGDGGGEPSETDPPPDPSREPQPDPPSSEGSEQQPAPQVQEPLRQLIEPSAPAEAEEPVAVVEQLLPRVAGTADEAAAQLGEKVDAVSTSVTRLSCDAGAEWDLPELCLPGLELPGLELPGLELPGLELPGLELPGLELPGLELPGADGPAPGQGQASSEDRGTVVDGRAVTVAAPPGPVAARPGPVAATPTSDLINGPPASAATVAASTTPPPQTDAAPLPPPIAMTGGMADPGRHGLTLRRWPGHPDAALGSGSGDSGSTLACPDPVPDAPVPRYGKAGKAGGLTSPTRSESVPAPPG